MKGLRISIGRRCHRHRVSDQEPEGGKTAEIIALSCGLAGIYGFINSKAAFYNIIQVTFDFSDTQIGNIWSMYGIASLAFYSLGGCLADRFPSKQLIAAALFLSAFLHLAVSYVPRYNVMFILAVLFSISSVLLFFPASSKMLSIIKKSNRGSAFGFYYAVEGIWNTLLNLIFTAYYSYIDDARQTFVLMMRIYSFLTCFTAFLLLLLLPRNQSTEDSSYKIRSTKICLVIRNKTVWLIGLASICGYILYCSIAYITPYLSDVFSIIGTSNLLFAIIRVNIMAAASGIVFAMTADRVGITAVMRLGFLLDSVCAALILVSSYLFHWRMMALILTTIYAYLSIGIKSISLGTISEQGLFSEIMGTVIGFVSLIGFLPDAFFYRIVGGVLDRFGGSGFLYLFLFLIVVSVIGYRSCLLLQKTQKRYDSGS